MVNVHLMDKSSIKPLETQATVVGKCRQTHDVRHCKERRFTANYNECLIYSGY